MLADLVAQIGPAALAGALAIVFVAAVVQTSVGMGFGQVAAPALLLVDAAFVPAPVIIMAVAVGAAGALRERSAIATDELAFALGGRVIGAGAAVALLAAISGADAFALLFAGLTLFAVAMSLSRWRVLPSRPALLVAGTFSGLMGTITTIGAPPMAIVYQHAPGERTRTTLNAFFALGALVSLAALAAAGLLAIRDFALAALLSPGFAAGAWAGRHATGFVDRRFRPLVLTVATLSAIVIVARTLAR